jgi:hypothetical protein
MILGVLSGAMSGVLTGYLGFSQDSAPIVVKCLVWGFVLGALLGVLGAGLGGAVGILCEFIRPIIMALIASPESFEREFGSDKPIVPIIERRAPRY